MRFFRFKKLVSMETSKYLRYAVGEVILVVVGILIALQVNNLNEAKKWKNLGAQVIGGCCGTSVDHIKVLKDL